MKVVLKISDDEVPFTDIGIGDQFLYGPRGPGSLTLWTRLNRFEAKDHSSNGYGCCTLTVDKDTGECCHGNRDPFLENATSPMVRPVESIEYHHGS